MALEHLSTTTVWKCDVCNTEETTSGSNPFIEVNLKGKQKGFAPNTKKLQICKDCLKTNSANPIAQFAGAQ